MPVLLTALALVGALRADTGDTQLLIRGWPNGKTATRPHSWTLSCPGGGTLPRPRTACTRLAALAHPFVPVPPRMACTQVYGGPAVALVTGRFRGQTIRARFTRGDGCQIARWNRLTFLFPGVAKR